MEVKKGEGRYSVEFREEVEEVVCEREWEEGRGRTGMGRKKGWEANGKKKKEKRKRKRKGKKTAEHQASKGRFMMANRKNWPRLLS